MIFTKPPSAYRHIEILQVRYARWDLRQAYLVDPHTHTCLSTLYPQDKSANANSLRRALAPTHQPPKPILSSTEMAPLLKKLMSDYAATGLPPAYLPKLEGEHE